MYALSDKLKIALVVVLLIIVSAIMYAVNKNAKGVNCNQSTACPGWENSNATSAVKTCNLRTGQWAPGNACGCDITCPASAPFPDCTNKTCKTSRPDPHPPTGKCNYELRTTGWDGNGDLPSRVAGVVTDSQGVKYAPGTASADHGPVPGGVNVSKSDPKYLQFTAGDGANADFYPGACAYAPSACWPQKADGLSLLVGEGECPAEVPTTTDRTKALTLYSPYAQPTTQPVCYNPEQGLLALEIVPGSCATGYQYVVEEI